MTRCLAADDVFPSLRLPVLIEEDAVSDTARMAGEELEVPRLRARSESLQSLGISEPMDQFILVHATDARLEIFDLWLMPTRRYEEAEEGQGEHRYGGGSKHRL
jgi:hypothetical protein